MAVNVKIGKIYKYKYKHELAQLEVYTWDFDMINCYWLDSYEHPPNSLILILDIFNANNVPFPMLKVLIDGFVRYIEYAPEVSLKKI